MNTGLLLLVWAGALSGQVASGSLSGVVSDQTGAVVGEVRITARNGATGFTRTTLTGTTGQYRLEDLAPGSYTIRAEKTGFLNRDDQLRHPRSQPERAGGPPTEGWSGK